MRRKLVILGVLGLAILWFGAQPAAAAGRRFVVFFQEWSAGLDASALKTIAAAAELAKAQPGAEVSVTGFADLLGSRQANLYLTETRAQVVTDQLTEDGVAAARIHQLAKGRVPYELSSQESRRAVITVGGP